MKKLSWWKSATRKEIAPRCAVWLPWNTAESAVQEDETDDFSDDGLVLVRQDCTPDGADEYVITEDEREIEQVVGRYVIESLLDEIGEVSEGEETWPCGENHRPGEFCYCGQNENLQ